jgi:hypothetical protein
MLLTAGKEASEELPAKPTGADDRASEDALERCFFRGVPQKNVDDFAPSTKSGLFQRSLDERGIDRGISVQKQPQGVAAPAAARRKQGFIPARSAGGEQNGHGLGVALDRRELEGAGSRLLIEAAASQ